MTTLFIRYPAKASIDSGAALGCPFALVGDGGDVQQQGVSPLGNLAGMVAAARRVVLLLAAADVTLLRVNVPPLSPARLKAALPGLVEEQILGDPADCVLAVGPAQGGEGAAGRTVAVAQRAWLEVLVKALVEQGAHAISLLPAQLCLPLQPGAVSAALAVGENGYELTVRQSHTEGLGLTLPADAEAALHALRALAGDSPVTLYLPAAELRRYEALVAALPPGPVVTLQQEHWAHWVAAARSAAPDLASALGATGTTAQHWQRWRWPLRLALLALAVNVAGLNIDWLRMKREADSVHRAMLQTFKAAYPNETVILDPAAQMRKNIAMARADSGEMSADEFGALSAAFGEALNGLPRKDIVAALEYRERALQVKVKPNTVDAAAMAQIRAALAAHKLELSEAAPGVWKVRVGGGSKS